MFCNILIKHQRAVLDKNKRFTTYILTFLLNFHLPFLFTNISVLTGEIKRNKTGETDKENKDKNEENDKQERKSKWSYYKAKKPVIAALESKIKKEVPAKAVLFVQYTKGSSLANEIRKMVQSLKPWIGIGLIIVGRADDKFQDLLHKSDPVRMVF